MRFFSLFFHREASPYTRLLIYLTGFLYALHYALPLYIDSSFLKGMVTEKFVGLVFAVGNILTVLFLANMPKIFQFFGSRKTFVIFATMEAFVLGVLSVSSTPVFLIALYLLHQVLLNSVFFSLDIILESHSPDHDTGKIRGAFFTLVNFAVLLGPFLAGIFITDSLFQNIYLFAAAALLPAAYLIGVMLPEYREPRYDHSTFGSSLRAVWKEENVRRIFGTYFLLQFFFAWMVIYMPIYLHEHIGFEFREILGFLLPIALLPFVLFDFFIGVFADKDRDEKRGLIAGFFLMGVSVIAIPFLNSQNIFLWAALLFVSRIGAALVEIMSESYFYKHTSARHAEIISDWRNIAPSAFIIAPLCATALFSIFHLPFQFLFILLGILLFFGVSLARKLVE